MKGLNLVFGEITSHRETTVYTAVSDWRALDDVWKIRMYPIHPDSEEPLEHPSLVRSVEDLWPSTWNMLPEQLG